MHIRPICLLFFALMGLSSCSSTKNITYFQDVEPGVSEYEINNSHEIRLQPKDKISIIVNTDKAQLTNLFNLPHVSQQLGTATTNNGQSQGLNGYTLDANGDIDFPIVGKIHVQGMTREEVAETVKNRLITEDLVKNPVVTVEFLNLTIDVLGEVTKPGRFNIDKDEITILDALSLAGDLTIYGKRERVLVLRDENGKQKVYEVNLLNSSQIYNSPVYFLQQNDVVYVEPNKKRARDSTVNGNTVRSTSFWISLGSLFTSIAVLVTNILL